MQHNEEQKEAIYQLGLQLLNYSDMELYEVYEAVEETRYLLEELNDTN